MDNIKSVFVLGSTSEVSKEICIESCKNYSIMYMAKPNCILAISVQDVFDKFNNIILKNTKTI